MKIIRGWQHSHKQLPTTGCVATIGNFDGVHRGHQQLILELQQQAKKYNLPLVLITMEPHPQEYFSPHAAVSRLTRFREKMAVFQQLGVQYVTCLRFNEALANLSAEDFVRLILVKQLNIKYLIVGEDFRFGHDRTGDYHLLNKLAIEYGFKVEIAPMVISQNEKISSTRIRQLLKKGELTVAAELLNRPYRICGRVIYGDMRGRQWGIPTANVALNRKVSPLEGVYAVQVYGITEKPLPGVANVGHRPTVEGQRCLLEVHLFNFDADIYRRHIEVEFLHKLRNEQKFVSVELLKQQILEDIVQGKAFFDNKNL